MERTKLLRSPWACRAKAWFWSGKGARERLKLAAAANGGAASGADAAIVAVDDDDDDDDDEDDDDDDAATTVDGPNNVVVEGMGPGWSKVPHK